MTACACMQVNVGPLEFDGTGSEHSTSQLRLTAEEIALYVQRRGFEVLEQCQCLCSYTTDMESMFRPEFHCFFFVARKIS